jgi:hypothetical protein
VLPITPARPSKLPTQVSTDTHYSSRTGHYTGCGSSLQPPRRKRRRLWKLYGKREFYENPEFKEIKPNYRKNVLEVTLRDGRKIKSYSLPFAVFRDVKIISRNRFTSITIDRELGDQAVSFVLADGSKGDFPADFVLYYCDPTYHWSPLNQLKSALKDKISTSRLSVCVIADALDTSPSQVVRLLQENKGSKQIVQLIRLAELAGYQIEFSLKKKRAA